MQTNMIQVSSKDGARRNRVEKNCRAGRAPLSVMGQRPKTTRVELISWRSTKFTPAIQFTSN